jgi:hypothetical protein
VDLHFLPEDPSRPPPGGGRGKGEAGAAGLPRTSTRRTLAAAVASAAPRISNSPSCSLKFGELHFIRRVLLATGLVGQTCVLIAVRHLERRRIITEAERRCAWFPNRPATWVRTAAPSCGRHMPSRFDRRSNALDRRGNVGAAQARKRHGIRKPRDGLPAWRARCTWGASGSDRRWACWQVETVSLADDGVLRDAHPPADLCRRVPFRPKLPQLSYPVVRPFEFGVHAAHQGLLLLFHRNHASRPAGGAPGKGAQAPGRTLARGACRQAPLSRSLMAACFAMSRDGEATESQMLTGTISPNGIVRLRVGVSQITGRPGSCGWSLQCRSVA